MKKTNKKIGLKTETLCNLAQHEIRYLADHEIKVIAGGTRQIDSYHKSTCLI